MLEMDPEVRKLWTDALRSGEYAQGKESLTRIRENGSEEHCCLGVLCKLALKAGIKMPVDIPDSGSHDPEVAYAGETSYLPRPVMNWAGLQDMNPILIHHFDGNGVPCSVANDDENLSFDQIADLIDGGQDANSE